MLVPQSVLLLSVHCLTLYLHILITLVGKNGRSNHNRLDIPSRSGDMSQHAMMLEQKRTSWPCPGPQTPNGHVVETRTNHRPYPPTLMDPDDPLSSPSVGNERTPLVAPATENNTFKLMENYILMT